MSARFFICTLLGMAWSSVAFSQAPSRPFITTTPTPIAHLSEIKSRATTGRDSGKITRFVDTGQREFAVKYDEQGRVQSVQATARRHIGDILAIGYDDHGRVIVVALADGNVMYYSYAADGSRQIRDRSSVVLGRGDKQPYLLTDTIDRMDALMSSLGQ